MLKMEICNTFSILCFIISRKVKMQLKCKKKNCAVYGECAVTDGTCQMVPAGDFSLDDAPQSGRTVDAD